MQVVTDPQKADAILTDHIGPAFEQKLDELYGKKRKGRGHGANRHAERLARPRRDFPGGSQNARRDLEHV